MSMNLRSPTLPLSIAVIALAIGNCCWIRTAQNWKQVAESRGEIIAQYKNDAVLLHANTNYTASVYIRPTESIGAQADLMSGASKLATQLAFEQMRETNSVARSNLLQKGIVLMSYISNCRTNPLYLSNPELAAQHRQRILEAGK